ncbi:putative Histone chaperone ASF1A [Blattamonas nauphoetae]|uniref:Histone chaperone ASF1A n=1 Tax=Blattamonas nauphoetae TaxID=2049346 RepID=A0ABQ9Y018_9EUKA|nr:putative Histone chaperone ASF1A [Blattamonas nauphoetae]
MNVDVTDIIVENLEATFFDQFVVEIQFECKTQISDDLEWKLIYIGSPSGPEFDQELESVLVGPVTVGKSKFKLVGPHPDPTKIPNDDLVGVSAILISCWYRDQEFIRVGYYLTNEYADPELVQNPPEVPDPTKLVRKIINEPRITRFQINWNKGEEGAEQYDYPEPVNPEAIDALERELGSEMPPIMTSNHSVSRVLSPRDETIEHLVVLGTPPDIAEKAAVLAESTDLQGRTVLEKAIDLVFDHPELFHEEPETVQIFEDIPLNNHQPVPYSKLTRRKSQLYDSSESDEREPVQILSPKRHSNKQQTSSGQSRHVNSDITPTPRNRFKIQPTARQASMEAKDKERKIDSLVNDPQLGLLAIEVSSSEIEEPLTRHTSVRLPESKEGPPKKRANPFRASKLIESMRKRQESSQTDYSTHSETLLPTDTPIPSDPAPDSDRSILFTPLRTTLQKPSILQPVSSLLLKREPIPISSTLEDFLRQEEDMLVDEGDEEDRLDAMEQAKKKEKSEKKLYQLNEAIQKQKRQQSSHPSPRKQDNSSEWDEQTLPFDYPDLLQPINSSFVNPRSATQPDSNSLTQQILLSEGFPQTSNGNQAEVEVDENMEWEDEPGFEDLNDQFQQTDPLLSSQTISTQPFSPLQRLHTDRYENVLQSAPTVIAPQPLSNHQSFTLPQTHPHPLTQHTSFPDTSLATPRPSPPSHVTITHATTLQFTHPQNNPTPVRHHANSTAPQPQSTPHSDPNGMLRFNGSDDVIVETTRISKHRIHRNPHRSLFSLLSPGVPGTGTEAEASNVVVQASPTPPTHRPPPQPTRTITYTPPTNGYFQQEHQRTPLASYDPVVPLVRPSHTRLPSFLQNATPLEDTSNHRARARIVHDESDNSVMEMGSDFSTSSEHESRNSRGRYQGKAMPKRYSKGWWGVIKKMEGRKGTRRGTSRRGRGKSSYSTRRTSGRGSKRGK